MLATLFRTKQGRDPNWRAPSPFSSPTSDAHTVTGHPAAGDPRRRVAAGFDDEEREALLGANAAADQEAAAEEEDEDPDNHGDDNEDEEPDEDEQEMNEDDGLAPLLPIFEASHLDALPVYNLTHAIRLLVVPRCETTLTWDQLRSPQVSAFVVKPIQRDIITYHFNRAVLYALMANCLQFSKEASESPGNSGTSRTRAMVCELLAMRLLKEYSTRELIDALSYDFFPLQGLDTAPSGTVTPRASGDVLNIARQTSRAGRISTLEVAIRAQAKRFLAHPLVVQQLEAIWSGFIVFHSAADNAHRPRTDDRRWPARSYGAIPTAHEVALKVAAQGKLQPSKQREHIESIPVVIRRSVTLYDPQDASLFKLSRLRVPRYRSFMSTCSLAILLGLFVAVLYQRSVRITWLEILFWFWSAGFMLDEVVGFNEQGFSLYILSFWNAFDLGILVVLLCYYILRLLGLLLIEPEQWSMANLAYDVLAINAVLLFPRLFSILDHYRYFSQLLIAFRLMAQDLIAILVLIVISCSGFFVAFSLSFGNSNFDAPNVAYALFQILMGFTPAAWDQWPHYNLLGKTTLVLFLFITHFLVVTILITVLTNSFMTIVQNANDEHQFVFAVNTISMVKSDSLFSYIAPTNIIGWLLSPLRSVLPFRRFVRLNRTVIKVTHLPILFSIFLYEKYILRRSIYDLTDLVEHRGRAGSPAKQEVLVGSKTFTPQSRLREPSVATYQKDRTLDEVFRRPFRESTSRLASRSHTRGPAGEHSHSRAPRRLKSHSRESRRGHDHEEAIHGGEDSNSYRHSFRGEFTQPRKPRATQRSVDRRQNQNVVNTWMQKMGPDSTEPPLEQDQHVLDRLESRRSDRRLRSYHRTYRSRPFRSSASAAMSDPEDFVGMTDDHGSERRYSNPFTGTRRFYPQYSGSQLPTRRTTDSAQYPETQSLARRTTESLPQITDHDGDDEAATADDHGSAFHHDTTDDHDERGCIKVAHGKKSTTRRESKLAAEQVTGNPTMNDYLDETSSDKENQPASEPALKRDSSQNAMRSRRSSRTRTRKATVAGASNLQRPSMLVASSRSLSWQTPLQARPRKVAKNRHARQFSTDTILYNPLDDSSLSPNFDTVVRRHPRRRPQSGFASPTDQHARDPSVLSQSLPKMALGPDLTGPSQMAQNLASATPPRNPQGLIAATPPKKSQGLAPMGLATSPSNGPRTPKRFHGSTTVEVGRFTAAASPSKNLPSGASSALSSLPNAGDTKDILRASSQVLPSKNVIGGPGSNQPLSTARAFGNIMTASGSVGGSTTAVGKTGSSSMAVDAKSGSVFAVKNEARASGKSDPSRPGFSGLGSIFAAKVAGLSTPVTNLSGNGNTLKTASRASGSATELFKASGSGMGTNTSSKAGAAMTASSKTAGSGLGAQSSSKATAPGPSTKTGAALPKARPILPPRQGMKSAPNLAGLIAQNPTPRRPSYAMDLISDLGDNKAVGGGFLAGGMPASFSTHMAFSGYRPRDTFGRTRSRGPRAEAYSRTRLDSREMSGLSGSGFGFGTDDVTSNDDNDDEDETKENEGIGRGRLPGLETYRARDISRARHGDTASGTGTGIGAGSSEEMNEEQRRMSKLMLARMNTLEEGFREVLREVKDWRREENELMMKSAAGLRSTTAAAAARAATPRSTAGARSARLRVADPSVSSVVEAPAIAAGNDASRSSGGPSGVTNSRKAADATRVGSSNSGAQGQSVIPLQSVATSSSLRPRLRDRQKTASSALGHLVLGKRRSVEEWVDDGSDSDVEARSAGAGSGIAVPKTPTGRSI